MKRFVSLLAIVFITTSVGCTLCSNCDDNSYGAFGGVWERSDSNYGRVGSAFTPAGFSWSEESSQNETAAAGSATSPQSDAEAIEPPAAPSPPTPPPALPRDGASPGSDADEDLQFNT